MIDRFAILLVLAMSAGVAEAVCLNVDDPSSPCRYPQGDAWCAKHDGVNLYAYRNDCLGEGEQATTPPARRPAARPAPGDPVPVWDCARARTSVEKTICANPDIRAQDVEMGALYAELLASGRSPERMQKAWLRSQRDVCQDADCLRAVYAERIRDLERLLAGETAGTGETAAPPVAVAPAPAVSAPAAVPTTAPEPAAPLGPAESMVSPPPVESPQPAAEPESLAAELPPPAAEPGLTPITPLPDLQPGIPELPPPEVSYSVTAEQTPLDEAVPESASKKGPILVLVVAAVLAIVYARLRRRRTRARLSLAAGRAPLQRFVKRIRAGAVVWLGDVQRLLTQARAWRPVRAAEPPRRPAALPVGPRLSDDTLARLWTLARPGESLDEVVTRAIAALETTPSDQPPTPAVLSRLAALEARLAQLEGGAPR